MCLHTSKFYFLSTRACSRTRTNFHVYTRGLKRSENTCTQKIMYFLAVPKQIDFLVTFVLCYTKRKSTLILI